MNAQKLQSFVYGGGGASNALQVAATCAGVAGFTALATKPTPFLNNWPVLDLFLMSETAAQTCTVVICHHRAATVLVGGAWTQNNIAKVQEIGILGGEHTFTTDRVVWGLAAGTDRKAKEPVRPIMLPGYYVSIWLSAINDAAKPFYAVCSFAQL